MNKPVLTALALATVGCLCLTGCPKGTPPSSQTRDQKVTQLSGQYNCHIGGLLNSDTGALTEPLKNKNPNKVGHVTREAALAILAQPLGNGLHIIKWCQK